ncbi:MAG: cell division protein FtsQ/DivIB [Opitutaceae bacterium]
MSKSPVDLPVARHWRDLPQEVKPRAMSREGRRRVVARALRFGALGIGLALAGAAAWQVAMAMQAGEPERYATSGELIGGHIELESDGVLNGDTVWLRRTLALPAAATLDTLRLDSLRARVLASGQVKAAVLLRQFPHTLDVRVSERAPVARVRVARGNEPERTLLVARDGTVYEGRDYDPLIVDTLPWLAGIAPKDGRLGPVAGMERVADLLALAKVDAPRIYRGWRVVSLARWESDGLIEVRTARGRAAIFGTSGDDFEHQLGRLEEILDVASSGHPPVALRRIDLSFGRQVPVTTASPDAGDGRPEANLAEAAPPPPEPPAGWHFQFHLQ